MLFRAASVTKNVELLLNDRAAVVVSDADDLEYDCPLELNDPQNHLVQEAVEAEWSELNHVSIRLSEGARRYVAGYCAKKVILDPKIKDFIFCHPLILKFSKLLND